MGDTAPTPPASPARVQRRRRVRPVRLAVIATLAYAGVCVFVGFLQTKLIYFPSRDLHSTPRDVGLAFEDVTLQTADGLSLGAWFIPARRPRGALIFCHGNAGNIADRLGQARLLNGLSLDVLLFDYRGYGRSHGTPTESGTYADADAAWKHLTEVRGRKPAEIIWFGESLGGAVAIESALRHPPAALIVEATFTSLVDLGRVHYPLLPVNMLLRHRYESIRKVGKLTCPKLFIHAGDDELVPISNARTLFAAAAEPKQFLETGGGHNTGGFGYDDRTLQEVAGFIDRALGPKAE